MLPKSQRLNLKTSFKWVASGKHLQTPSFKLMVKFSDNPLPLVGIALSKDQFKKAVDRNRARRLTSKAIEGLYPSLLNRLNLVIMPKAVVLEKSPDQLSNELKNVKDLYTTN